MSENPTYPGVYIEEVSGGVRTIAGVSTSTTAFVGRALMGPIDTPTVISSFAQFTHIFGGLWAKSAMSFAVQQYFANGGGQAVIVRVLHTATTTTLADGVADRVVPADADGGDLVVTDLVPMTDAERTGIYALDTADIFNLLCLPPPVPGGFIDDAAWQRAATYCEKRRAMLLIDPKPATITPDNAITDLPALLTTSSRNAAVFYPRILMQNPLDPDAIEEYPPSGAVAGVFARTDMQRGVWKAPAGLEATLTGVQGLTYSLTDAENGRLNPLAINCLRTFPRIGPVVWGSRTMDGKDTAGSEWKYIPVRRTALFIEESLYRGLKWAVFEPNDEPLWAQIRLNAGTFMNNLFRQGAFQGTSPRDAWFVKCGSDTTTQNDIDRGIVNVEIGFAPLRPAEFVIISIQQIAGKPGDHP